MNHQPSPGQIRRDLDYANAIYWLHTHPERALAILRKSHTEPPCEQYRADLVGVNGADGVRGGAES